MRGSNILARWGGEFIHSCSRASGLGPTATVLRNRTEVRPRSATPGYQIGLAGILVRERGLPRHYLCMLGGGLGQRGVPIERSQTVFGPVRIGRLHHLLLHRLLGLNRARRHHDHCRHRTCYRRCR
jgi:hypothetical protein